jgi:DNA-binding LacI/PurR family transcriptional regulator
MAYNDQVAIGIIKGLRKLDVRVPDDVSVVGFDDITFAELMDPQLTTVASPLYRMGFVGVQNCIAVAGGARPSAPPLKMPTRLVVRQSTGQRKRYNTSPARGTTRPSKDAGSIVAGSR